MVRWFSLRLLPERLAMFLMAIIFATLLVQIGARVCGIAFSWGQEFVTFAFVWFVFFAIAAAYCRKEHMVVDVVYSVMEKRLDKKILKLWLHAVGCIEIAVTGILATGLLIMTVQSWSLQAGAIAGFRIGYLYLGAFFSTALCILVQITSFEKTASLSTGGDQ